MKLTISHLFLILLGVLLLSDLGFILKEGLSKEIVMEKTEPQKEAAVGGREVDDDLYILKSKIVPPVCPKCPDVKACPRQKPCPPCPACARCPEDKFTCKKVPDYDVINTMELPKPVLNDFSSFGP